MNMLDQFYAVLVYVWSEISSKAPAMGFIIATTVALLKAITERDLNLAEIILCGIFAAIACTGGEFLSAFVFALSGFHIDPNVVGGFVSGVIGYAGTKNTMTFIKNKFIKDKVGKDDTNE